MLFRSAFIAAIFLALVSAAPTPPDIPSGYTASAALSKLTVAPQGPQDGYSRAKFPHWITIDGNCNTRETVLKRDGTDITVGTNCQPRSGQWVSPYENVETSLASDLDIDHLVPLSNAWKSGAAEWTTDRRRQFANDLSHPQLLAVTDNLNEAKGDQGPEDWKPPLESYWCTYASMWVEVKSVYNLTVTVAEKSALGSMLGLC